MIELPRLYGSQNLATPGGPSDLGWSAADELAALETVWDCLCQEAATHHPAVQLPPLPAPRQFRVPVRASGRRRVRRGTGRGRLAS